MVDILNLFGYIIGSLSIIISALNITMFSFRGYRGFWYWVSWIIIASQLTSLYFTFAGGTSGISTFVELIVLTILFIFIGIFTVKLYNKNKK